MSEHYRDYPDIETRMERRTRFTLPAMMSALICGGLAVGGIWPPEEVAQDPYLSWLASPVFIALCLLGALVFTVIAVLSIRADNLLWKLAEEQDRQDRQRLMQRLGGEGFARRWEANPPVDNRLRELRRQRDLDADDVASLLGCAPQTYLMIEKGLYSPDVRTTLMLADLFNAPVGDLFWIDQDPSRQPDTFHGPSI
ncbi:MAG: helix-turn-helix transcriptional regulator [Rubrobacteraceae bacterium]